MAFEQLTPPSYEVDDFDSFLCPSGSVSTNASYNLQGWSPESGFTHLTTPERSPAKIREAGPMLLPRVRLQDQLVEPVAQLGHMRTTSLPTNGFPMQFGAQVRPVSQPVRRSASPANYMIDNSFTATPASQEPSLLPNASLFVRPSLSQMRSRSASNIGSHSRNSSSGSIDASQLVRYGYPTYRQSPASQPVGLATPMSRTPSALNHLTPISMPGGHVQSYPQRSRHRTTSPPAMSRLSVEYEPEPTLEGEKTSILEYLTKSNPTPSLTQRTFADRNCPYFWFDVRNTRSWSDFNFDTISAVPDFLKLLEFQISEQLLPTPGRVNTNPETHAHLAELCASHHAVKVNAALRVAQGERHMAIRAMKAYKTPRQQPDFVSNYQSDAEKTIYGDGRGRVVGIVRCFDEWNSGMRGESAPAMVRYLRGLAALHHQMREHGCRYGFIMTEIELVCVRAGGQPSSTPLFGFLEIAAPIQMSTHGLAADGKIQMTAGLALWYLHMLAKEQPLPGQYSWKMDVGGPTAHTRANHLPRDDWMPKPSLVEKRESKRVRGWYWPDEPVSRQERGRSRKNRQ